MNSLLLATLSRGLFWILLALSLYLLFRGHNAAGGGFIGGLVAATAFILVAKAMGQECALRKLKVSPIFLVALGLLVALFSGMISVFYHEPYMTGVWSFIGGSGSTDGFGISNILLFDIGVFLIVLGGTLSFFFLLEDAES